MHDYIRETIPAWYQLSAPEPQTLEIRVSQQLIENSYFSNPVTRLRDGVYFEEILQTKYTPPAVDRPWGFGNAFTPLIIDGPWFSTCCRFPQINLPAHMEAPDYSPLLTLVPLQASLALLFKGLKYVDTMTEHSQPQLFVVEGMLCDKGMDGAAMSVSLTPALCSWLAQQPDHTHLEAVETTMRSTYEYFMSHAGRYSRFAAECRQPNLINLQVPGNACGLDPEAGRTHYPNEGYQLVSHNVDSAPQQLALLMGLAKLHDLVRQVTTPVE